MTSQRLIDGVSPDRIERPSRADEVSDLIREANATGDWVLPVGGATALTGANSVESIPIAMELGALQGIQEYEPTDLTVSVQAGTTWSSAQQSLAENGQTLPIDVPFPDEATIGGVVAAGYAGPRRLRDGTLKDLLLGVSFVRGDGLSAKAGGMVVKNVSGFEIPRLLHGSMGSLAVITSVNLKVMPKHEHDVTLLSETMDTMRALELVLDLTTRRSAIAAAVVDGNFEESAISVRLTGLAQPTRGLAREISGESDIEWSQNIDDHVASANHWQTRENQIANASDRMVTMEIGTRPASIVDTVRLLGAVMPRSADYRIHVSPGTGGATVIFPASSCNLDTWRGVWREHGFDGHARHALAHAPVDWRKGTDAWSIAEGPLKLMQSLKSTFDPRDVLNRGRLWTAFPMEQRSPMETL